MTRDEQIAVMERMGGVWQEIGADLRHLAALERDNVRLRKALAFAASALESGELHAAPLIREALEPPVEGVPGLEGEARDG